MTEEALKFIADKLSEIGLRYRFMRWKTKPAYPYYTGEYIENDPEYEDGCQEVTFLINGFTRGSQLDLERDKNKIRDIFPAEGLTAILDSGSGIAVSYSGSQPVQTEDIELKRIQINLSIKEWMVN